jgi:HAD superfamily hydrolase (TIGR01509 family)
MGRPRALLFDLDGTLVDSDSIHLAAWQAVLRPHGVVVDAEEYRRRISGRLNPAIVADYLPAIGQDEARVFAARKEAAFREAASSLQPVAGLLELMASARAVGVRLALVTNAPVENTRHVLGVLGLNGAFDIEVLGDELPAGKPDPLPYRHALGLLDVPPEAGVAFEDSVSGIRSATGAGLPVVGVATTQPSATLAEAGADPIVADFTDPALLHLLAL